jgi:broad specificity phosphatase PhoE
MELLTNSDIRDHHPDYFVSSFSERFLRPRFNEESVSSQAHRVAQGLSKVLQVTTGTSVVVAHFSSLKIIANFVTGNWDTDTFAEGDSDLDAGTMSRHSIDPVALARDIETHFA